MKAALVTGITGQDGAYLSQFLLKKGYRVFGSYRRSSSVNFWRIEELNIGNDPNLELVEHDVTDLSSTIRLLNRTEVSEIYNLAAQSFVGISFDQPIATAEITAIGALNILEAIRIVDPSIRFYQASTSEMFGKAQSVPQVETTPFYPRSPYGIAKLFAHWATVNYRESYGMFAASGILFNHESPLRGREFVTRKITDGVAKIYHGKLDCLELGNLDARRDWGFAGDYVDGIWRMLQVDCSDNYILATNRTTTVRSFATHGVWVRWRHHRFRRTGHGRDCPGMWATGRVVIRVDPRFNRPAEVDLLIGDPAKARARSGLAAHDYP